jgi:hypothetical protein
MTITKPLPTAKPVTTEVLRLSTLRDLLRSDGPCITIVTPPYRPGEPIGSPGAQLKSYIHEAAAQLGELGMKKGSIEVLTHRLEQFADDPAWIAGSQVSRVIFRSPDVFEVFDLTHPVPASLTVGATFSIRKLYREISRPAVFYVLDLTKTGVSLLRCAGLRGEVAKLPPSIPATLAEAMAFEPPDHDLENRATAGKLAGEMRGVRFGTGSGREREQAHLLDYYKIIDRGLKDFFRAANPPLVLAGVEEEIGLYRSVNTYPHLIKTGIRGSIDFGWDAEKAVREAYAAIYDSQADTEKSALASARERMTPSRLSTELEAILTSAFEGRVDRLYLDESAQLIGSYERRGFRTIGTEDLLNIAAVQTVLHHGTTYELPADSMRGKTTAAALLRY